MELTILTRPCGSDVDQGCAQCGSMTPIEVLPLQRTILSSMSDWLCSVPTQLTARLLLALRNPNIIRNPCQLVQYYKMWCEQQKVSIDRMNNEIEAVKELKRCAVSLHLSGNFDTDMY